MKFSVEIPYGNYWSTPFTKWQGSLANLNSIEFAAWVAKRELENRKIPIEVFDYGVLGTTIPQKHSFYGMPWLIGMLGSNKFTGPSIGQACATGVRILLNAAQELEFGLASCSLVVAADRCSNGAHLYYPNPNAPGGTGDHENWVLDNFSCDPLGGHAMVQTADNVARENNISTEYQHEIVLRRLEQYQMAIKDNYDFQKRYMSFPFEIPSPNFKRISNTIMGDEGLATSTPDGLSKLRSVVEGGTVTFGGQTHPADGNTALVLASPDKAKSLSKDPSIQIRVLGFGSARVELAHMPAATVPAALKAIKHAGLDIQKMDVIKSHNPFAVNDIYFAQQTGIDVNKMNNYGCSLIWGHPQGPTALRSIIELIEELVIRGGGYGLFEGCAAGDSAMAVVIEVSNR
jgi:acetyl-CoA acetyltransferase